MPGLCLTCTIRTKQWVKKKEEVKGKGIKQIEMQGVEGKQECRVTALQQRM